MIFGTLRLLIWLAGLLVVVYFGLSFFGYTINWDYYHENRARCEEVLKACQKTLIQHGLEGAKAACQWKCFQPDLLIKPKAS